MGLAGWRNYLKGLFDLGRKRILVTGSARLDFYRFGGDSLQGRYQYLRLHPFSAAELRIESREDWDALLRLGGFPEPFLSGSEVEAKRWSREYRSRLIRDDLADLERIQDLGNWNCWCSACRLWWAARCPSMPCARTCSSATSGWLNGLDNVRALKLALGVESGKAFIQWKSGDALGGRLSNVPVQNGTTELREVQVSSLDRFAADCAIEGIDLLKVDVEGHEADVLLGASRVLRSTSRVVLGFHCLERLSRCRDILLAAGLTQRAVFPQGRAWGVAYFSREPYPPA